MEQRELKKKNIYNKKHYIYFIDWMISLCERGASIGLGASLLLFD